MGKLGDSVQGRKEKGREWRQSTWLKKLAKRERERDRDTATQ